MRRTTELLLVGSLISLLPAVSYEGAALAGEAGSWVGALRAGYATANSNRSHSVRAGSWAASAALSARILSWLSVGPDVGAQRWKIHDPPPSFYPGSRATSARYVSLALSLEPPVFSTKGSTVPFVALGIGLYGREFDGGRTDNGPGVSLGLGVRQFFEAGSLFGRARPGLGLILRRHYLLMDDYGVALAGPSYEWTKTIEVAAEFALALPG